MNNTTYFLEDIDKYGREFDTQVLSDNQDLTVYDINSFQPRFNCSLFQSVMRVLEIDSNLKIEKGSYITGKLGVKFDRTDFEYITYNNYYISEEPEYDEDTKAYVFTAYDKMIEAMIEYDLEVSYPITVRNFLIAICEKLGWNTSGIAETFINSETILYEDVYTGTGFTYRDVLDEIAKITCSFPGFYSDVFQLKYITETGQTINNDYLSQDDLTFSKEYFINSVVFSRAEESDNYYKQDAESIEENGLSEYRLSDLQILSVEDRSKFMNEMYDYLTTLKFWIFNIKSTGIFVFEPADLFTIETDDNSYSVLCLNSEGVVEQGLTEQIYAEEPDESETDYTASTSEEKADRTTRILVNKVEKEISALVEELTEYESNYTELKLSVDGIESTVENITNYTREKTQIHQLYLSSDEVPSGEEYILDFVIYGGDNFTEKTITLCASTKSKGYGDNLDILLETGEILTTEDEENLIVGDETYYTPIFKVALNDVLRSLTIYTEEEETTYYDTLEITQNGTVILTRRIGVDDEGNLYLLEEEIVTTYGIEELLYVWSDTAVLPTFEEGTYFFIKELNSITYYAQYTNSETYLKIAELGTYVTQNAESVQIAWNQISQYIKFEGTDGLASLNIYDEDDLLLMSLNQDGQTFYNGSEDEIGKVGVIRGEDNENDYLAFAIPVDWENSTDTNMAWGLLDTNDDFYPVFYMQSYYGEDSSEYGGELVIEGNLRVTEIIPNDYLCIYDDSYTYLDCEYGSISAGVPISAMEGFSYIGGTANGTLFPDMPNGGITVSNGLITNWDMTGYWSGTVTYGGLTLTYTNGLLTNVS